MPQGRGGRIDVKADLTVEGFPSLYVVGDVANIPGPDGKPLPQLGSVALQGGAWAADNLLADFAGRPAKPFKYKDKGIMAMIGRDSAIAAMGPRRREVHGLFAFAAWLGVHAILMTGIRNRMQTFVDWAWSYFSVTRGPQNLDRTEAAEIDWSTDGATSERHDRRKVGHARAGRRRELRRVLAAGPGAEPDGVHARVPHHPRVDRRRLPGADADRQLPRPAQERPRRDAARASGGRRWRR